jgi:hypothetical protein
VIIREQAEYFTYLCDYVVAAHGLFFRVRRDMHGNVPDGRAIGRLCLRIVRNARRNLARGRACVYVSPFDVVAADHRYPEFGRMRTLWVHNI